jgi:hypothetical protein
MRPPPSSTTLPACDVVALDAYGLSDREGFVEAWLDEAR